MDDKLFNDFFNEENLDMPYPNLLTRIPKEEINELMYSEPVEITNYEDNRKGTIIRNSLEFESGKSI